MNADAHYGRPSVTGHVADKDVRSQNAVLKREERVWQQVHGGNADNVRERKGREVDGLADGQVNGEEVRVETLKHEVRISHTRHVGSAFKFRLNVDES